MNLVGTTPPSGRQPLLSTRDEEFTTFMSTALPTLTRAAWYLCGDVHQASDLVQHALLRTYVAWPRSSRAPLAYARKVMANKQVDSWHARRREVLVSPQDLPEPTTGDTSTVLAERDRLERALRRLGARQRRIVVLRHVRGLSEKEVAELLGISVGTVKSTTSRGLERLRDILGQETPMNTRPSQPPPIDVDTDQVVRRGRRRQRARAAAVVAAAVVLVVGVGAGVMALRSSTSDRTPVSPVPTSSSSSSPSASSAAGDGTVFQLETGDRFRLTGSSWELDEQWHIVFNSFGSPSGHVVLGQAGWMNLPGSDPELTECATASSCAEAQSRLSGNQVKKETVGDVTYYKVEDGSRNPTWYFDWEGHAYEFGFNATTGDFAFSTALVESADWTGTKGTVIGLPHGAKVGFDLSADWEVSGGLGFTPADGDYYDGVSVYLTSCSSASACAEESQGEVVPEPAGTRTVNGVTYYLNTWGADPGHGVTASETWECEWNGSVYRFHGDSGRLAAFMQSVEWIE
ncbi:MAG: SigE family RNA polymerase sigma factor [Micrococcales bacterium]|nr:SigE family RNA polymerase sigma factor [Micrococcales bacterium]